MKGMTYEGFMASGRFQGDLYDLIDDWDDRVPKAEMVAALQMMALKLDAVPEKKQDNDEDDDD